MNQIIDWIRRHLENPQLVSLLLLILGIWLVMALFGAELAPVFAAVVLAYLLEGPVAWLTRRGVPRRVAALAVWAVFVIGLIFGLLALLPLLSKQVTQIFQEIPQIAARFREWVTALPAQYPSLFTEAQIHETLASMSFDFSALREGLVARTRLLGVGITYIVVYLLLVPLMVFFLLKDTALIAQWARRFLPEDSRLIQQVWRDIDRQLANYVRGKVMEILIVWTVTYLTFSFLDLRYAMLLAAVTGFSVLVPYVGATVVTFPVAAVAYAQWGLGSEMGWVLLAYGVIQALDGNVLVPLLFSEAVNLHPVAIIASVLFFGGVWGFWGVFFAIPLATVIAAVIRAWPAGRMDAAGPSVTPGSVEGS